MTTRQDYTFSGPVAGAETTTLVDPVRADVVLAATIANRHHDLMASWGNPASGRGMYYRATGSGSIVIPCRVPPGVELMDVSLLAWGSGTITLTTSADATGTQLWCLTGESEELAEWLATGGPIDPAGGAGTGRAFQAVASESWDYQDVDVTVTFGSVVNEVGLLGVWWRPVRQRRV